LRNHDPMDFRKDAVVRDLSGEWQLAFSDGPKKIFSIVGLEAVGFPIYPTQMPGNSVDTFLEGSRIHYETVTSAAIHRLTERPTITGSPEAVLHDSSGYKRPCWSHTGASHRAARLVSSLGRNGTHILHAR
jgi:hypothetical protein